MNNELDDGNQSLAPFLLAAFAVSLLLVACASVQGPGMQPAAEAGIVRPVWHAGDRWVYSWTTGTEGGIKTSDVIGVQEVGGVRYYILRVDNVDRFYTLDLHWAAGVVDSKVVARAAPPEPWFNWPLAVGRRWEYQGMFEERNRKDPMHETYKVVGGEEVQVPAGTFQAYKLVREVNSIVVDQYWYAPEVRWYVKWVGRRGKDEFQEVLQQYAPAPQTSAPKVKAPGALK